jgi:hypothetical protein
MNDPFMASGEVNDSFMTFGPRGLGRRAGVTRRTLP